MSEWKLIEEEEPPEFLNVLLAFSGHWNQVVGFRSGERYWETSAHDYNSPISGRGPKWWCAIPQVPHHPKGGNRRGK